jgi:hypothetical protein
MGCDSRSNRAFKTQYRCANFTDTTGYRFPLLIADEGGFKDVELSVKFKSKLFPAMWTAPEDWCSG